MLNSCRNGTHFSSPPDVGKYERELLLAAFDSNWIAPVGPDLLAFENEFCAAVQMPCAVAVSSGTAALHLILHALSIGPGDVVLVSSFTFAATAFAVSYTGATPVFIDSEIDSWNIDPDLVESAIEELSARGQPPKALIAVDLYGRCADYDRLVTICSRSGIFLIEDAAEALGASTSFEGSRKTAGSFGVAAAFSFNGNKIMTTSGGGMVVTSEPALADKIRYLSTQAREQVNHYEHLSIGFNYRLSNLLAALGRGQLRGLEEKVRRRRAINQRYRDGLSDLPGLSFDPLKDGSNCWLSCIRLIPSESSGIDRHHVGSQLAADDIESRPLWKPMHRQPVFAGATSYVNGVSDRLFKEGLCLPSGSSMKDHEIERVISNIRSLW